MRQSNYTINALNESILKMIVSVLWEYFHLQKRSFPCSSFPCGLPGYFPKISQLFRADFSCGGREKLLHWWMLFCQGNSVLKWNLLSQQPTPSCPTHWKRLKIFPKYQFCFHVLSYFINLLILKCIASFQN